MEMDERREHEALERLLSGRSGFGDGELDKLAALARALERNRPVVAGPRPAFRDALRARVIAEARHEAVVIPLSLGARIHTSLAARDARIRKSFRMVVATAAAAMMLLVSGAAFAVSANDRPDQALYGMKRAREAIQLAFTFSAQPKAQKHLNFARNRFEEVHELLDAGIGDASVYNKTLADMNKSTAAATSLLIDVFRSKKDPGVLQPLIDFTAAQRQGLETVVDEVPPAARPAARGSLEVLVAVQDRVSSVLGGCPCPSDIFTPAASSGAGEPKPCTCSSTRNDANGLPTHTRAAGPATEPTSEPSPEPTATPTESPSPPPGPIETATNTVTGLIDSLLPSPTPLPGGVTLP
jgi:hypothetical protein